MNETEITLTDGSSADSTRKKYTHEQVVKIVKEVIDFDNIKLPRWDENNPMPKDENGKDDELKYIREGMEKTLKECGFEVRSIIVQTIGFTYARQLKASADVVLDGFRTTVFLQKTPTKKPSL